MGILDNHKLDAMCEKQVVLVFELLINQKVLFLGKDVLQK